jgi:hypothetical protein
MFGGQLIVGGWVSLIVTMKLQRPPPTDEQLTAVVPFGKNEPEGGLQVTAPQAGGEGTLYVTTAPHWFGSFPAVMFAGQVSPHEFTVTVNEHIASGLSGLSSDAVQVTVVVPSGKQNPDGGVQTTIAVPQLSDAVGVM